VEPEIKQSKMEGLKPTLGPVMLWGLGVGYVISGMYFGWNLGLEAAGTLGLSIALFFIILMYITFTFSYAELACAIPQAGGAFVYAEKAFGRRLAFIAGIVQIIEFLFAPPAIAAAIGAYFNLFFPSIPVLFIAITMYILFTSLNIYGVKAAASFELIITILAVVELLVFAGITLPHFEFSNIQKNNLPHGFPGIFAAIPFAIWFFLGIEGVANVAEETIHPQRNVLIGFGSAIFTLVALCLLTFFSAAGVEGWEAIVYPSPGTAPSDSPLPLALRNITGGNDFLYHMLITIGLVGLVASFHGIILAAGRITFEFGRTGYAHHSLSKINGRFKTPANALLINMFIGILALLTGKTAQLITISCFGALSLYIISMLTLLTLRKKNPLLERPFKVPFYPWFPAIALVIAVISFVSMIVLYLWLSIIFFAILIVSILVLKVFSGRPASLKI
jgi:ethanolamine permease